MYQFSTHQNIDLTYYQYIMAWKMVTFYDRRDDCSFFSCQSERAFNSSILISIDDVDVWSNDVASNLSRKTDKQTATVFYLYTWHRIPFKLMVSCHHVFLGICTSLLNKRVKWIWILWLFYWKIDFYLPFGKNSTVLRKLNLSWN